MRTARLLTLLGFALPLTLSAQYGSLFRSVANYSADSTATVSLGLYGEGQPRLTIVGFELTCPAGWSYAGAVTSYSPGAVGVTGEPQTHPAAGSNGTLGWTYTSPPPAESSAQFSVVLSHTPGLWGYQTFSGKVRYRDDSGNITTASLGTAILGGVRKPVLNLQPVSQSVGAGSTVTFTANVDVSYTFGLTGVQWRKNGVDLPGANNMSGVPTTTLSLANVSAASAGSYSVALTNSLGETTASDAAILTVVTPPVTNVVVAVTPIVTVSSASSTAPANSVTAVVQTVPTVVQTVPAVVQTVAASIPAAAGRLLAVSTRAATGPGAHTLIAGFVITGSGARDILLRAVGPGLAAQGVTGVLANPRLKFFRGSDLLLENDDWSANDPGTEVTAAMQRAGLAALAPGSRDAALLVRLDPGTYTAQVTTEADLTGIALVEVYDVSPATAAASRIIAISTRGDVGSGGEVMIAGFVVGDGGKRTVLVRGLGPALGNVGVNGVLSDPRLRLYRGSTLVAENDNWSGNLADSGAVLVQAGLISSATSAVGLSPLSPGSKDAAILTYLDPGTYTVQLSGVDDTTGVGLLEIYEGPPSGSGP